MKTKRTKPTPLGPGITRCLDSGCPECMQCRRWLERPRTKRARGRLVAATSLYPYDQPLGYHCPCRIKP